MPFSAASVNRMPYCIPNLRNVLPFVNKTRRITRQQSADFRLGYLKILISPVWIRQINATLCNPFASCGFPTPLWPLKNNGPSRLNSFRKDFIYYSMPILTHDGRYYNISCCTPQYPFGSLDDFRSAVWTSLVRQFGRVSMITYCTLYSTPLSPILSSSPRRRHL